MARGRFLLLGIAILLIHSAANAQTQPAAPVPRSNSDVPAIAPPPDPQPKHDLQRLVPDGFGGLKEDPPMTSETPDGVNAPNSPTIAPNSIVQSR
jgi:hypothetical protein